jgi:hypothetical protein
MSTLGDATDVNPVIKFLPHTVNHVAYGARTCPLRQVIYHSCDKGSRRQSLLSTVRCCNVCGRNLITGLTSAASPRVDMSSTCKVGHKLGVSLPLLTCSLWRDHPGYCTAEVGNAGGTYELPRIDCYMGSLFCADRKWQ